MNPRGIFHKHRSHKSDGENTVIRLSDAAIRGRTNRRLVLSGFPWGGKFKTIKEVDEYFSGSEIQCLLCGKVLKALPKHLFSIHGLNADQYREKFSIPWTKGLVCQETSINHSMVTWKRIKSGDLDLNQLSSMRKSFKKTQRLTVECFLKDRAAYLKKGRESIKRKSNTQGKLK